MRAIVIRGAKDLSVEEREVDALKAGEVRLRIVAGGICGSDLHYYNHGGFGAVRLREPMILGHEVCGTVEAVGEGVEGLAPGTLVAVCPSRPCWACRYCRDGAPNHCLNMRFYGSAMPMPHIQGAFREVLVAEAAQCVPATGLTAAEAAMAEPLSVCLHAAKRAGDLLGRRVLVTGAGPIGALAILVARRAGAGHIVATDLSDNALRMATALGADAVHNVQSAPDALEAYSADKGTFDVVFECSGSAAALAGALAALRPRGIVVQVGLSGDMSLPMAAITGKEIELRGSFRFHEEFALAVHLMQQRLVDVRPLVTHTVPLEDALSAFRTANDRERAMKVQIAFS